MGRRETSRRGLEDSVCSGEGIFSLCLEEKGLWIWDSVLANVILGRMPDGLAVDGFPKFQTQATMAVGSHPPYPSWTGLRWPEYTAPASGHLRGHLMNKLGPHLSCARTGTGGLSFLGTALGE